MTATRRTSSTAYASPRPTRCTTAARGTCHFSYAPQHSYTSLDLSDVHVHTRDVWYVNADGCGDTCSVDAFANATEAEVRSCMLAYFTTGVGKGIDGGLNTTNAVILDIEECPDKYIPPGAEDRVNLKYLGLWLAAERARAPNSSTFQKLVDAYRLRAKVARALLPHADLGFYGSPNGPDAFAKENFTLAMEGYVEAARRGIFDDVTFLLPVLYFGANESSPKHDAKVYEFSNQTLAAALRIKDSKAAAIPIFVNTKFTYGSVKPFAASSGWVEPETTRRLVDAWRATPRVARIVYWYYPDSELAQYQQPNLTEIGAWWRRARPVPAECF